MNGFKKLTELWEATCSKRSAQVEIQSVPSVRQRCKRLWNSSREKVGLTSVYGQLSRSGHKMTSSDFPSRVRLDVVSLTGLEKRQAISEADATMTGVPSRDTDSGGSLGF
jgi:hypothetical protein